MLASPCSFSSLFSVFFHFHDDSCRSRRRRRRRRHRQLFTLTIYWLYWIRLVFGSFWLSHLRPCHDIMHFQCALFISLAFSHLLSFPPIHPIHFSISLSLATFTFERLSCFTRSVKAVMLFAFNSSHRIASHRQCAIVYAHSVCLDGGRNERAASIQHVREQQRTDCETIIAFNNTVECH